MLTTELAILAILLGLIPAVVARRRGRHFFWWWIYGAALFIVALPHALLLTPDLAQIERQQTEQGLTKCPFCAEMIKPDANVCRYCGRDVPLIARNETAVSARLPPGLLTVAHLVYALHSLSILIGVTTAATVVGAFVFGLPSIVAVIINYVKRAEAHGTFLESHFRWQIRTFWSTALWCLIGGALFITLVGIPIALAVFFVAGLWAIYRIVRGWLALRDRKPMYSTREEAR